MRKAHGKRLNRARPIGTPNSMSPEHSHGQNLDTRTDISRTPRSTVEEIAFYACKRGGGISITQPQRRCRGFAILR